MAITSLASGVMKRSHCSLLHSPSRHSNARTTTFSSKDILPRTDAPTKPPVSDDLAEIEGARDVDGERAVTIAPSVLAREASEDRAATLLPRRYPPPFDDTAFLLLLLLEEERPIPSPDLVDVVY